jgi:putative hydrolase of the HAD superfamily
MCDWPVVQLMPNALEALKKLSKSIPCHLATNARDSQPDQIRTALHRVGLDTCISRIYCFNSVGHPKPSPSFFEFIQQDLKCKPAELVMVGDDLEGDVIGAIKCGLQALWYNPKAAVAPPRVHHITDLIQLTTVQQNPAGDIPEAAPDD